MGEKPLLRTIWSMAVCMGLGNLFLPGVLWRVAFVSPFDLVQGLAVANVVTASVILLLGFAGSRSATVRANSVIAASVIIVACALMWYLRGQLAAYV